MNRRLDLPASWPPTLVVVIDTEEEFDWSAPADPLRRSVRNIAEQGRAQAVFDMHGLVPTYVIDHPVATTPEAVAVLRGFADSGRCEIGAHLHPWVNPPHDGPQGPVAARDTFPGNLPPAIERARLACLTEAIEAGFGRRPTTYKAGRYGIGPATPGILRALGYTLDISVVPHTDFSDAGGPDFTALPDRPFAIADGLVEIPLSVGFAGWLAGQGATLFRRLDSPAGRRLHLPGIAARLGLLERLRLSPEGHTQADMLRQIGASLARGTRLFMMTYHSSSLLPGAAPYVADEAARDRFVAAIDATIAAFRNLGGQVQSLSAVAHALVPA